MNAQAAKPMPARRPSRRIRVGNVDIGDNAPVSVQTMTKTDTRDVTATTAQILTVQEIGCDIVRLAIPDKAAAEAIGKIKPQVEVPLIADIHFDHSLALMAIDNGIDGLRLNPGNIGGADKVAVVVEAARGRGIPIRIGVNSGSLEKDILEAHGSATAEALVESAMRHVKILEDLNYHEIKISVKATDVQRTVRAYRLLSRETDYPLHLGVTEAGTLIGGTVRSCVAMGILLNEGIGDTIRVSLTDSPVQEVRVALDLLRSLGLREPGPSVISCPTCGRIQVDVIRAASKVENELEKYYRANPESPRPTIAVMGCMVNGPGEAKDADIAIAGGDGRFALYVGGEHRKSVAEADAVAALMEEVRAWSK